MDMISCQAIILQLRAVEVTVTEVTRRNDLVQLGLEVGADVLEGARKTSTPGEGGGRQSLSYLRQISSWRMASSVALMASTRWPPKSWAACSMCSLARRSAASASRI